MTMPSQTDTRPRSECTLCADGIAHHVFITSPPGWGSIMTCSHNSRRQGVVVRNDDESAHLRAQRASLTVDAQPSRAEYAVSAASGELRVYATRAWAEAAAEGATERLLARTVTNGRYSPWRPYRGPEEVPEGMVEVPRPHVPHGSQGFPEDVADANYLREAAQKLEDHYKPFGSNLRATVVQLLRDTADAVAGESEEGT